jgi:hypothetical protein
VGEGEGEFGVRQGIKKKLWREKKDCGGNKKGTCKRGFVKLLTNKSLAGAAVLRVKEYRPGEGKEGRK